MSNSSSFPLLPLHSNPKFETYRLSSSTPSTTTTASYSLPGSAVTQGRVHGKTLLSAKEVESRIKHDHLGVGGEGGWFCWVDEEWGVWAGRIGEDFHPQFSSLGTLPVPLPSSNSPPAEYPSVWSLSSTTYLLSDGHGRLYPLRVRSSSSSSSSNQLEPTLLGPAYELNFSGEGGDDELRPFKVEWVGGEGEREVLISSVRRERLQDGAGVGWGKEKGWEVMLVRFGEDWDQESGEGMEVDSGAKKLEVLWTLKGEDVPLYAHFSSGRFLLGSSSHYSLPNPNPPVPTSTSSTPPPPPTPLPQSPFTWTQTSTSLTIIFPSVPTKPSSLTLQSQTLSIPALLGFAPEDSRTYWDAIKPSESTWTYEQDTQNLTLELEKLNAQTRWPSLFTPSPSQPDDQQRSFEDIPETLTLEQSSAIAANLAKFTSSFLDDSEPAPSSFPGIETGGMSSLMRQEMDLDEEEEAGEEMASTKKEVKWTFVSKEGEVEKVRGQETILGREMGWGRRSGLGAEGKERERFPEVLVKGSLDALLFSPPSPSPTNTNVFTHLKTFPALSYVLSSKREIKYILHTPVSLPSSSSSPPSTSAAAAVLVFSSPTTAAAQGDCFVYYDAEGGTTARSGVVKLGGGGGDGEQGSLLGVKGVDVGGERVLVGLCERRVVVVRGVI